MMNLINTTCKPHHACLQKKKLTTTSIHCSQFTHGVVILVMWSLISDWPETQCTAAQIKFTVQYA